MQTHSHVRACDYRQNGVTLASADTAQVLSSSESRSFWIQWYHGEIVVGKGSIGNNDIIVSYYDPSPAPITAATFTGNGAVGTWHVALVPSDSSEGKVEFRFY